MDLDLFLDDSQQMWEKQATVRSYSRIIFKVEDTRQCFPLTRQPLCLHPDIEALGHDAIKFILIQSFYKFSNDIAIIETRLINQVLSNVINIPSLKFSDEQKINLFTIMVDEAYHAYVAYDAFLQVQKITGIKPITLPDNIEIEHAINFTLTRLPQELHDSFKLIAVCLAENVFTQDLKNMINISDSHSFFQRLIEDHLVDEHRHSGICVNILRHIWSNMSVTEKNELLLVFPEFITRYLTTSFQRQFDQTLLSSLGFNPQEANEIITDTHIEFPLTRTHPILKNIITIFSQAHMLDDIVKPVFLAKEWL